MRKYNYRTQMWEEVSEEKKPLKQRIADGLHETAEFVRENKEVIVAVAPIVLAGAGCVVRGTKWAVKQYEIVHDLKVTNRRCYDPSAGHYWNLKRTLTNADWLLIQDRQMRGEKLGYILEDLKVLKK